MVSKADAEEKLSPDSLSIARAYHAPRGRYDPKQWMNYLIHPLLHTLSGRIGKVVASHAAVAHSSPAEVVLIYTMHVAFRGYCS